MRYRAITIAAKSATCTRKSATCAQRTEQEKNMAELSKKVALITGAGSGIGQSVALELGRAGYAVVLAGRRREPLEAVAQAAKEFAAPTLVIPTDVSDPAAVKALFAKTKETCGRLALLLHTAGVGAPPIPLEELSFEQWKKVVDINLTGAFLCTQEAFRIMKDQTPRGGRIINNGSISAHAPRPFSAPYTATKHAITGLTKSTSLDGRAYDIACGQIDIGNAVTELAGQLAVWALQPDGSSRAQPTMDVGHVADAIVHMASLPLTTNILTMTIMATKMPFVGRG